MFIKSKEIGCAAAFGLAMSLAANGAQAYEPGDVLVQLLAEGFYSDASGHIDTNVNYDSGPMTLNPALNITYFFTKNIAAQTVLAVPLLKVDLNIDGDNRRATSQRVLPLSLIGQYHFLTEELVSPYVGAGMTYAILWEDDSDLGSHVGVNNTWGGLINFGLNIKLAPDSRWVAVFDVKKWWLSPTKVRVGGNDFDNLTVNPWFFGAGIGYNFSTPALF
jgi:outer membrane protein